MGNSFSCPNMDSIKSKSNLHYTRLIPFRMSRVSGAHLRGFAPGPTHQGCSGGESLATCGRFDRLGNWNPYLPHQRQTSHHLRYFIVMDSIIWIRLIMTWIKSWNVSKIN